MNKLHDAEVSLELCRAILAQRGQNTASRALRGIELPNVEAARLAHGMLKGVVVFGQIAGHAKAQALEALESAISEPFCGQA